ncbi:hypothetical protein ACFUN8_01975 [Streptomyces sp. NPDC057307]|uniref:hypothetical protein n=1 Tax=Streptomyces sp. NPDC057307 TaxID=3346096 RepID=UPI00364267AD
MTICSPGKERAGSVTADGRGAPIRWAASTGIRQGHPHHGAPAMGTRDGNGDGRPAR